MEPPAPNARGQDLPIAGGGRGWPFLNRHANGSGAPSRILFRLPSAGRSLVMGAWARAGGWSAWRLASLGALGLALWLARPRHRITPLRRLRQRRRTANQPEGSREAAASTAARIMRRAASESFGQAASTRASSPSRGPFSGSRAKVWAKGSGVFGATTFNDLLLRRFRKGFESPWGYSLICTAADGAARGPVATSCGSPAFCPAPQCEAVGFLAAPAPFGFPALGSG
jgi:hypothetical protein